MPRKLTRSQASQNLAGLVSGFQAAQMVNTARELNSLSKMLQTATSFAQLRPQLKRLLQQFERDWRAPERDYKLYMALRRCTNFYLQRKAKQYAFTRYVGTFERHLEARRKAEDTIRKMIEFARASSTEEEKVIWMSLVYVLAVEGVFDQSVRMLYVLVNYAETRTLVILRRTHDQTLWDIKRNLERLLGNRRTKPIFEGWQNHLRNSIAHANFSFDSSQSKMVFRDFVPGTGIRSWGPRCLSLQELTDDYYQKLENVSSYLTFLLWIMIARDTISRTL